MKRFFATFHCSEYDANEYTITQEIYSSDPHSVVLPNNNVFCFEIIEREKAVCKGQVLKREKLLGRYAICGSGQVHSSYMIPASELKVADHPIEQ